MIIPQSFYIHFAVQISGDIIVAKDAQKYAFEIRRMPEKLKGLMFQFDTITEGERKLVAEIEQRCELLFKSLMNEEKA